MGKRSEADTRIIVRKLPFSDTTDEGRFYAMVDGRKVGERGRMLWRSKPDALRCGVRFLTAVLNKERPR